MGRLTPRVLSFAALVAGVAAGTFDVVAILATESDLTHLRWWFILLPLVLVPAPLLVSHQGVRIAAAAAMTGWSWLGTFSVGPAFIPCVLLMWFAAAAVDRPRQAVTP